MPLFRRSKAASDDLHVSQGRADAALRFLLKGVQDVYRFGEAREVDRPVGISIMLRDDFQNARAHSSQRLRPAAFLAALSDEERVTDIALDVLGEAS